MPKFGNSKGKPPPIATGKYAKHEMLPNRAALNQLTGGNPEQRSLGNYSKLTPSGISAPSTYQTIIDMANPKT
jgi:hypothetical protein